MHADCINVKIRIALKVFSVSFTLLLAIISGFSCFMGSQEPPRMWNIKLDLSLSGAPRPGETAELTCLISCAKATENMTVTVQLPETMNYVSGNLIWRGSMQANTKVEIKSIVKASREGAGEIKAVALLNTYRTLLDVAHLYLDISPASTTVSQIPIPKNGVAK
jgi:hypothetical protein